MSLIVPTLDVGPLDFSPGFHYNIFEVPFPVLLTSKRLGISHCWGKGKFERVSTLPSSGFVFPSQR